MFNLAIQELRPNCLLTPSPLVFISGPRSFFYRSNYWKDLPLFLHKHGYKVTILDLSWNSKDQANKNLETFLQRQNERSHFFFDSTWEPVFLSQIERYRDKIASYQTIQAKLSPKLSPINRIRIWSHERLLGLTSGSVSGPCWTFNYTNRSHFDNFLNQVIFLAENELADNNRA